MFAIVSVLIIILDQISKMWVKTNIAVNYGSITSFIPFLNLRYIHNDGAAFSILQGKQTLLIAFTSVVMLLVIIYVLKYRKTISKLEKFSLALILGGGVGNLIDRIAYSYVIDFIEVDFSKISIFGWVPQWSFPIFNIADIAITCGCILFAIIILFVNKTDERRDN